MTCSCGSVVLFILLFSFVVCFVEGAVNIDVNIPVLCASGLSLRHCFVWGTIMALLHLGEGKGGERTAREEGGQSGKGERREEI